MFDSKPTMRKVSARTFEMVTPLIWTGTKNDTFVVPTGFVTDLASVPQFMMWLIPPYGAYTEAAILHDYLIVHLINHPEPALRVPSRDVDGIFRRVMHDLGTPWMDRWTMWAAVRLASLFNSRRARGRQVLQDAPAVVGIGLLAGLVNLIGAVGVLISLALGSPFRLLRPKVEPRSIARREPPAAPHERN